MGKRKKERLFKGAFDGIYFRYVSVFILLDGNGVRLQAFVLSCLVVYLTARSTESPGRHLYTIPDPNETG